MPSFENLRVNHLSPEGLNWFAELLRAIEAFDLDAFIALTNESIEASPDNGVTVQRGRDEVRKGLTDDWAALTSILHDEINIYGSDSNFVHEARTELVLSDGRTATVPALVAIDRDEDGQMLSWRVYKDSQGLAADSM